MKLAVLIRKVLENNPAEGLALLSGDERETRIWWENSYWIITQTSMGEFEVEETEPPF